MTSQVPKIKITDNDVLLYKVSQLTDDGQRASKVVIKTVQDMTNLHLQLDFCNSGVPNAEDVLSMVNVDSELKKFDSISQRRDIYDILYLAILVAQVQVSKLPVSDTHYHVMFDGHTYVLTEDEYNRELKHAFTAMTDASNRKTVNGVETWSLRYDMWHKYFNYLCSLDEECC